MIIFFTSSMYREVARASKEAEKPVVKAAGAIVCIIVLFNG